MLKKLSLRAAFPLALLLVGGLFAALSVSFFLPRDLNEAQRHWQTQLDQNLLLLQSSLADNLRQGKLDNVENNLSDLASLADVRWAMLLGDRQQVLAATKLGLQPGSQGVPSTSELADYGLKGQPHWLSLNHNRYLAIYPLGRVDSQGAPSAELLLVNLDANAMLEQVQRTVWRHLAETLMLLCVLGALLNLLYNRLVTRRLTRLEKAANKLAHEQPLQPIKVDRFDEIGHLTQAFMQMADQLQIRQLALQESEERLRELINSAPIGMLVVDTQFKVVQGNSAVAKIFGCNPQELLNQLPEQRILEPDARLRLQSVAHGQPLQLTALRGSQQVPIEITHTPFDLHGQRLYLALVHDITERLHAEQRLRFLAHFDPLTQLANRHYLLQRLEQLLASRCPISLLFIDLDHFKRLNDSLGHEIGDRLLIGIGERLRTTLPERALLARSGGDEFVLLLEDREQDFALQLARQLLQLFEQPFAVRQYQCRISASIGLAACPTGSLSSSELLRRADLALYAAKDAGRNQVVCFSAELGAAAEQRQQLEDELRLAVEREEFVLFYQVKVNLNQQIKAAEALLRWQSPTRGLVPPDQFIPLLEESGLILQVSQWVFRKACQQARHWLEEGRPLHIAVNLSPLDFRQSDLAGTLLTILEEEQIDAQWLELEITESALLDADTSVLPCLQHLKAAGLRLYLDDFGTGYSSLSYLRRFPFDAIKIDRQFINDLPDSPQAVALVRSILTMAEQLNLDVVAEGVENERQAAFLRLNGCQQLQGYYYAKPLPQQQVHQLQAQISG